MNCVHTINAPHAMLLQQPLHNYYITFSEKTDYNKISSTLLYLKGMVKVEDTNILL